MAEGEPGWSRGDLKEMVIVHETDEGYGGEMEGAGVWFGAPYCCCHGLPSDLNNKKGISDLCGAREFAVTAMTAEIVEQDDVKGISRWGEERDWRIIGETRTMR